ncbi:MAG: dipeptide epimerase [Bryobacterales bacterium]|nr:dipeptide epimerase [Bryobacterales bacterium]
MTRRSLLATPAVALAAANTAEFEARSQRLFLRHTWTTTMSSSDYRDVIYTAVTRDGITGHGEGAPIVRYKESAAEGVRSLEAVRAVLAKSNWRHYRKVLDEVHRTLAGNWAAKAAVDIAVHDWVAQKMGVPLYQLFGLDPAGTPLTTFSIGIDNPEMTRQKVREAEPYPVLKIKVGLDTDEATLDAVRSVTKKPLRVDANEGWKTKEEAVRKINWLESQGVEMVEQPLPAAMLEEMKYVRAKVHIPVLADEACLQPGDVPKLAPYFDGVNVKIDKCGGLLPALRMIEMARSLKMKVMLGCMISSSVAVTAAAHLSPLLDYADLDGNLLIRNDPFEGVTVEKGKLMLPRRPGLGIRARATEDRSRKTEVGRNYRPAQQVAT